MGASEGERKKLALPGARTMGSRGHERRNLWGGGAAGGKCRAGALSTRGTRTEYDRGGIRGKQLRREEKSSGKTDKNRGMRKY